MAAADECLRRPRRKPKAKLHLHESPFPIPIQTITGKKSTDTRWYYYFGTLESNHVSVSRLGDLTFLYRLGFFGKGILSRSQPQFERYKDVLSDKGVGQYLRKFSRWEPEDRDSQISVYTDIMNERLRQHQSWVEAANEPEIELSEVDGEAEVSNRELSEVDGEAEVSNLELREVDGEAEVSNLDQLPQCVDLETEIHDELVEECSSESDDEVLNPPPAKKLKTEDDSVGNEKRSETSLKESDKNGLISDQTSESEDISTVDTPCEDCNKNDAAGSLKQPSSESTDDVYDKLMKLDDKYKVFECLQLTFEEAFFLSFGLGCLSVTDPKTEEKMSLTQMWKTFSSKQDNFVPMYAAYHHFRSKGWIVRFSKTYGLDFVLYQDGMAFHHASYCVVVRFIQEGKLESGQKSNSEQGFEFTWQNLAALCRVNERAGKEVLLCYVVQPRDMNEEALESPSCIQRLKIMETVLRRWPPEKFRESKE